MCVRVCVCACVCARARVCVCVCVCVCVYALNQLLLLVYVCLQFATRAKTIKNKPVVNEVKLVTFEEEDCK